MKQLSNVFRMLVVLVLVISASSLFVGCNNHSDENNASNVIVIEPKKVTEDTAIYAINGNTVTFSNFNKSERSVLGSMMMNDTKESYTITYKYTFNENFTKVTISDLKMDRYIEGAEENNSAILKDGFNILQDPETKKIIKANLNPLINKLK